MAFPSAKGLLWMTIAENFVLTFGDPVRLNRFAMWTQVMQTFLWFQHCMENNPNCLPWPLSPGPCPHFLLLCPLTALHSISSCPLSFPWMFQTCCQLRAFALAISSTWKALRLFLYMAVSFFSTRSLLHQLRKIFLHHISSKFAPHPLPCPITLFY